jgi:hypothetical protein
VRRAAGSAVVLEIPRAGRVAVSRLVLAVRAVPPVRRESAVALKAEWPALPGAPVVLGAVAPARAAVVVAAALAAARAAVVVAVAQPGAAALAALAVPAPGLPAISRAGRA